MSESVLEIFSEEEFNNLINLDKPVLVDFFATWCAPCKMQAPVLYEFKKEMGDKIMVAKVDVDQNPGLASQYGVFSIPTLMVFKGGEQKEKSVGLSSKANLSDMVIKYL